MKQKPIQWITAWPLSSYWAAYIDPKKSLPHKNEKGFIENPKGLPFWIPEQRYLTNVADYIDVLAELKLVEHVINDPKTGRPLIRFKTEKGKKAIHSGVLGHGMILLEYTPDLLAYRKRENGILGIESISGFDTRLGKAEYMKNPDKFPSHVELRKTNDREANFSEFDTIEKGDKK